MVRTAKLTPLATRTMELTDLVPPDQGRTHCPEASGAEQDDPGPLTGSYPAAFASDWNNVMENPDRDMVFHLSKTFVTRFNTYH